MRELDEHLFGAPFLLLNTAGQALESAQVRRDGSRAPLRYESAGQARAALRQHPAAAAVLGTLLPGVWAVDIDPTDAGTAGDPMLGDAAAEILLSWAVGCGLDQWVLRASGRPGGLHLIIAQVDEQTRAQLDEQAARVAGQLRVNVTPRRPLRLLESPHRLGLPAPLLAATVDLTSSPSPGKGVAQDRSQARTVRSVGGAGSRAVVASGAGIDRSPSGQEFGRAMRAARLGQDPVTAWEDAIDCQVVRRGHDEWLRYLWSAVVTNRAAELDMSEDEAWNWVERDCPARAAELGRSRWLPAWNRAREQAADPARARRWAALQEHERSCSDLAHTNTARPSMDPDQHERIREALHQAAEVVVAGRRPQVRQTMAAVVDSLAVAIARDGLISLRRLAEESLVASSTAEARRAELLQGGVIRRSATHREDGQVCDRYVLGPVASRLVEQAQAETRGRSCTPPRARTHGSAQLPRLQARHRHQRSQQRPPLLTNRQREHIDQALPAAARPHGRSVAASRKHQRRFWAALSPAERAQRLQAVRADLDRLSPQERSAWRAWLQHRARLGEAIDRVTRGQGTEQDVRLLSEAPMTVHHGRRDPAWREGGTAPRHGERDEQLVLTDVSAVPATS